MVAHPADGDSRLCWMSELQYRTVQLHIAQYLVCIFIRYSGQTAAPHVTRSPHNPIAVPPSAPYPPCCTLPHYQQSTYQQLTFFTYQSFTLPSNGKSHFSPHLVRAYLEQWHYSSDLSELYIVMTMETLASFHVLISSNLHIFVNRLVTYRVSSCLTICRTSKVVPQRRTTNVILLMH